jgi:uncharacterized protein (AIM24 family)
MSGLKRVLGGAQLFLTQYTAPSGGMVAFAAQLPGTIREIAIDPSDTFMIQAGETAASRPGMQLACSARTH